MRVFHFLMVLFLLVSSISVKKVEARVDIPIGVIDMGDRTPIIFLHGFMGSKRTFKHTVSVLEREGYGVYEKLYSVSRKGKVTSEDINEPLVGRSPLIIVHFKNNMASLEKQTKWLSKVLEKVKKDYGVEKVSIVAHSMGGVTSINYIMTSDNKGRDIDKLVMLDSPMLGADIKYVKRMEFIVKVMKFFKIKHPLVEDFEEVSKEPAFKELNSSIFEKLAMKQKGKFPSHIKVLVVHFKGSEVVSKSSAYGLKVYASNKNDNIQYKEIQTMKDEQSIKKMGLLDMLKNIKSKEDLMNMIKHSKSVKMDETDKVIIDFLFY